VCYNINVKQGDGRFVVKIKEEIAKFFMKRCFNGEVFFLGLRVKIKLKKRQM